jgi:hypothetical protein
MSVKGTWLNGELLSAYDEGKESMKDQKHLKNLMEIRKTSVLCSKPSNER